MFLSDEQVAAWLQALTDKEFIDVFLQAFGGAVTGSGTTNYVARWTPNGTTLGIGTLYDTGSWSASARVREKKRPISAGLTSHFVRSWRTSPVAIPVSPTRKAACADSSKLFPYHRGTIVQL